MSHILRARIIPDDGEPYEVAATTRDVLVWERTTHGAAMTDLGDRLTAQATYKLAWIAARRLKMFDGTLAEFEAGNDLEVVVDRSEGPGEADPTNPAP